MFATATIKPTAAQLAAMTDGQVLPEWESITFKPGIRGRPVKGRETLELKTKEEVEKVIKSGFWMKFNQIIVKFKDDIHLYEAHVEPVFEKAMIVIEGLGIVMSVVVGVTNVEELVKTARNNRLSEERRKELIAVLTNMTAATKRRDSDVAKEFGVTPVCVLLYRRKLGLPSVKELV